VAKSLHDPSPRWQILIFALLSVLVVFAGWELLIGPARDDVAAKQAKLSTLQGEVARAQATASRLPAVERDVKQLELALRATTAILPDEKDPQDVLRNLHDVASESALELASFTPKAIVTKPQYSEWPIDLGFEGGYHNLGRFFERVATMSRLVSVADLHIKVNQKATARNTITASCTATTFVFKKDAAPAPSPSLSARVRLPGELE
jgi:type IV pilus assembly protein PilO